ncbi:MAG: molecular chaperone TorD family protein [Gordonibacter sp.]|uniref:TorD/DmsD family molecular chaperone n=1 Tax=Gordonibacter sp. TaxID=1968902 RepID=UPI002FC5DBA3
MSSSDLSEMKEFAQNRALGYALFADLFFQEANEAFVERLRESALAGADDAAFFAEPLVGLNMQEAVSQLRSEYAALFLAMSATPVFTSESAYLSSSNCLMQEQRDQVVRAYRAEGFEVSEDFRQPEDHIAVELSFMSRLCALAASSAERGDDAMFLEYTAKQKEFYQTHIARWIPLFCQLVQDHPKASFFRPVACRLDGFLAMEASLLDEALLPA